MVAQKYFGWRKLFLIKKVRPTNKEGTAVAFRCESKQTVCRSQNKRMKDGIELFP